jgi:hypothetical protein
MNRRYLMPNTRSAVFHRSDAKKSKNLRGAQNKITGLEILYYNKNPNYKFSLAKSPRLKN